MNMKKTIAAIAAGAMAVSAMASSVSALELKDQVLHYNLVQTYTTKTNGTVTLSATFRDVVVPEDSKDLIVGVDMAEAAALGLSVKTLTLTGKYVGGDSIGSDTETIIPYTRNSTGENYDPNVENGFMVVNVNTAPVYLTNTSGAKTMNITVTAVCEHKTDLGSINTAIVDRKLAVWYAADTLGGYKASSIVDDTISVDAYKELPDNEDSKENIVDKTDYTTYDAYGNEETDASKIKYATLKKDADDPAKADSSIKLPGSKIVLVNGTTTASAFTEQGTNVWKRHAIISSATKKRKKD